MERLYLRRDLPTVSVWKDLWTARPLPSSSDGRMPFYHFDVYRIGDVSEMDEIGYEDCFYGDGVSLVEWGGLIEEILPEDVITVKIEKDLEKGFDYRRITVEGLE